MKGKDKNESSKSIFLVCFVVFFGLVLWLFSPNYRPLTDGIHPHETYLPAAQLYVLIKQGPNERQVDAYEMLRYQRVLLLSAE